MPQNISLSDKESHFDNICYDITFKYEHPIAGSSTDRRPITLYRPSLFAASTWDILRHSPNGLVKVRHDGFLAIPPAIDGPRLLPLTIYKGDFISLFPGESWSDRVPLDDDELADAFQLAERYRFQFIGAVVQWWDWGTLDVGSDNTMGRIR